MRKSFSFLIALILFSLILTVGSADIVISAGSSTYHPGQEIVMMLSSKNYLAKKVTWEVTSYDSNYFDISITDWNRMKLLFDNPYELQISTTKNSYTLTANDLIKNTDASAPWFYFIPKENTPAGTYKFVITVSGPNGVLDTINGSAKIVEHNFAAFVEKVDPTCAEEGYSEYACECGVTTKKDFISKISTHSLSLREKVDSTATKTGTEAYWECSVCGKLFSDANGKNEISQPVVIPKKKNGLTHDTDGIFRLYKNDILDTQTYGIVDFNGGRFFVANGEIVQANGLISDGQKWYYCSNGQVADYTGLALYDGSWFYVTNGILDTTRAGIVTYDGGRFMVGAGRIVREVNGLIQDPVEGKWYYVAAGQVADYTGLVQYDGAWFYTINGLLGSNFTGDVEYNGSWFHVENGSVVF